MDNNLTGIMKDAGIDIEKNDEFAQKSNAADLARALKDAIKSDISGVREKALAFADEKKAGLKKAAATAAGELFEKTKKKASDAAAAKAKLAAKKSYYE
jgi:hypothetical protein